MDSAVSDAIVLIVDGDGAADDGEVEDSVSEDIVSEDIGAEDLKAAGAGLASV